MKKLLAVVLSASFMMLAGAAFAADFGKSCQRTITCKSGTKGCLCESKSMPGSDCTYKGSCHEGSQGCQCDKK